MHNAPDTERKTKGFFYAPPPADLAGLDESGFAKKGKMSVGVARQWLGNLGKVDNGQVGVFSVLCNQSDATLINARLFLPEKWATDSGIRWRRTIFRRGLMPERSKWMKT
ncbi:transposase [Thermodesulfobacteriota bacterium]